MKEYLSKIAVIGSILMLVLATPGCKDDITFEAENKTIVDTMFLNRKLIMEQEIDSLCHIVNVDFYQASFDSIMNARIAQIEKQLKARRSGPRRSAQ